MKFLCATTLVAVLASAPLLLEAKQPADGPITFSASVRVDVDAGGKPVKVEAPADLPDEIRGYIEKRVATWQYQPAHQDGVAVAATTYVGVNACAVPVGGGYHLGLDFAGNGPRHAGDQALKPPLYPDEPRRRGTQAEFVLILDIAKEGTASIGDFEKIEFDGRGGRTAFRPVLERWVKTIHFDPELVAGRPVAGQVRMPVTFVLGTRRNAEAIREEFQTKATASRECQVAAGANDMKPVAMESVVKVTPVPAG